MACTRFTLLFLAAAVLAAHGTAALAQRFPARPITLVVGNAAGGGIDITARLLAGRLTEHLGQPVIVENRPGAAAKVANSHVARATPDGYTLLVTTAAGAIEMAFRDEHSVDALQAFAPVSTIASGPLILVVNPAVPVGNVRELVALARSRPGVLNYSSSGVGTTGHLCAELFKLRTATDIVHVPYKGTAPALTALLAGEVDIAFVPVPGVLPFIKEGRLRALATTGEKRAVQMPDLPTMKEAGTSGVDATVWYGVFAPAAVPVEVIDILARAIMAVSHSPDFRRRLLDLGVEPGAATPQEFAQLLRDETAKWAPVVKAIGTRSD